MKMRRLIYGSLSVLTAIGTVFVAAKAEVFSAENRPSANSEEIVKTELDTAGGLPAFPKGGLPTDGFSTDSLSSANFPGISLKKTNAANSGLISVPTGLASDPMKTNKVSAASSSFKPIARQALFEPVPYQSSSYQAQAMPETPVPAGIVQAQPSPAAKPGVVQQSVPPASASEELDPVEGDGSLTDPPAGTPPAGTVPDAVPGTFIVPATPNMAPEMSPEAGPKPGVESDADDPASADDLAPEGQTPPPLSPMPSEGIIRESNPSVTPVTPNGSSVPPAGISPTGAPPTGFPSEEAGPMTPLPSAPVAPSIEDPSMAPSADPSEDPSADPSMVPSADPSEDPSVEPEPIEPLPLEPLPPSPLPPTNDSAAPNEFPVSGSSSDRLVGEGFTPFQLSYLALAGGLEEEGIPGGTQLVSAYRQGDLSAEDVVAAGATSNRLGTAASDLADYTDGVDRFLEIFRKDTGSSN